MTSRLLLVSMFVSFVGALSCDGTAGDLTEQELLAPAEQGIELVAGELRKKPPKPCKGKVPQNFGAACNCSGTIGCDGECNVEPSTEMNECASCGGTWNCATGCSVDISNLGELCCGGLGTVQCGGLCSFVCF